VGANKGVLVTSRGFQAGAQAAAEAHSIVLFLLTRVSSEECRSRFPERSNQIRAGADYLIMEREGHCWVFGSDSCDSEDAVGNAKGPERA
jgi:hypothetical protein